MNHKEKYFKYLKLNKMEGGTFFGYNFEKKLIELYKKFLASIKDINSTEQYLTEQITIPKYPYKTTITSGEKIKDENPSFSFDYYKHIQDNFADKFIDTTKLIIENDIDDIDAKFEAFNIIELRPYKYEPMLVIACGNYPLSYQGAPVGSNQMLSDNENIRVIRNNYHHHHNCYTMDIDLGANPSMVCDYMSGYYPNISDNSFILVVTEGLYGSIEENVKRELLRIIVPNGFYIYYGREGIIYYKKVNNDFVECNVDDKLINQWFYQINPSNEYNSIYESNDNTQMLSTIINYMSKRLFETSLKEKNNILNDIFTIKK